MLDIETRKAVTTAQRNEITEYHIYKRLAESIRDPHNSKILERISREELEHYNFWKRFTERDVKPNRLRVWFYIFVSWVFGITFGIKLLEGTEKEAQAMYGKISEAIPAASSIIRKEDEHERELIELIDEERLRYVGSVVLGLNDALVELTGTLAGLTLALQDTQLIAIAGLVTGVAASLSMAVSEYLSTKAEGEGQDPIKSSIYTGIAYIITVTFLILPYLVFTNLYLCLMLTIINAIIVIFIFTFYISVAKGISFTRRFSEMTIISLGVAALTFFIGLIIRAFLHVEV